MRLLLLAVLAGLSWIDVSASTVRNIDILVWLQKDGSARIEERWDIDVDDSDAKTEWYISHRGLGDMRITGLQMKGFIPGQEGLQPYETLSDWDIDASRSEKTGKCGLNNGGSEVCWGFGDYGEHQYVVSYVLTNLVKGYDTNDGFNHCFLDMNCTVEKAKITIMGTDSIKLSEANTRRWAFGYEGKVEFEGNNLVAYPFDELDSDKRMIIMLEFNKGVFQPAITADETWAEKKQRALDGSDYTAGDDEEMSFTDWVLAFIMVAVCVVLYYSAQWVLSVLFSLLWIVLGGIWWLVSLAPLRNYLRRKKLGIAKGNYFRDVKPEWTLVKNKMVVDELAYFCGMNDQRLIGALLLRLVARGDVTIVREVYKKKKQDMLKIIRPIEAVEPGVKNDDCLCQQVLSMLTQASGKDLVLQPKEFENWCKKKKNQSEIKNFMGKLKTGYNKSYLEKNAADLFGLKAFLKDFSLLNERSMMELKLWDEYMVYAEFFGIADQVRKEMTKICPEYLKMSNLTKSLEVAEESDVIFMFSDAIYTSTSSSLERAASRTGSSSGYSSWSSLGGGGGFSGGGGGGGR